MQLSTKPCSFIWKMNPHFGFFFFFTIITTLLSLSLSLCGIIMMMMGVYFVQFHLHHFTCLLKYWLGWTLSMLYRLPTISFKKKRKKKKKLNIYTPIRVLGFRGGILQYDIVDINPRRGWSLDTHYINGPIQCTQFNFPIFFFFLFCLSRKLGFRVL